MQLEDEQLRDKSPLVVRPAVKSDAKLMACLINMAGEGIPAHLWANMCEPGDDPMRFGEQRAAREEGGFSYIHARICENSSGALMGMLISYPLEDPYDAGDLNDYPEIIRPMVQLEAKVPGSWYINGLATLPAFRRQGAAKALLADNHKRALDFGFHKRSLICASENEEAKRLYLELGFEVQAQRPFVDYPGAMHGGDWLLMVDQL